MFNQSTSRRFFLRRDRNTPIHVGSTESISPHRENLPSTRDGEGVSIGFWLKTNAHAPGIAFQLCGGMESYAPFFKQHALVVKGLHNVWLKPCPEGFRCSAFIAVVAHEDMSV